LEHSDISYNYRFYESKLFPHSRDLAEILVRTAPASSRRKV